MPGRRHRTLPAQVLEASPRLACHVVSQQLSSADSHAWSGARRGVFSQSASSCRFSCDPSARNVSFGVLLHAYLLRPRRGQTRWRTQVYGDCA